MCCIFLWPMNKFKPSAWELRVKFVWDIIILDKMHSISVIEMWLSQFFSEGFVLRTVTTVKQTADNLTGPGTSLTSLIINIF